eukprot:5207600-Pyramimonas_sp.AAC.1
MGFGWAHHFCRAVMHNSIRRTGFVPYQVVSAGEPGVVLRTADDTVAANYVDKYSMFGKESVPVQSALNRVSDQLRSGGLSARA